MKEKRLSFWVIGKIKCYLSVPSVMFHVMNRQRAMNLNFKRSEAESYSWFYSNNILNLKHIKGWYDPQLTIMKRKSIFLNLLVR